MELGSVLQSLWDSVARKIPGVPPPHDPERPPRSSPSPSSSPPSSASSSAPVDSANPPRSPRHGAVFVHPGSPPPEGSAPPPRPRNTNHARRPPPPPTVRSVEAFRDVLGLAEDGQVPLRNLLDEMYDLEQQLPYNTTRRLCAYLQRPDHLRDTLRLLTDEAHLVADPAQPDARKRLKYQFVIASTIANGPVTDLRMTIIHNDDMVDILLDYFTDAQNPAPAPTPGPPPPPHHAAHRLHVANEVARVLHVLFDETPEAMLAHFRRRTDALPALVRACAATAVADFVIRVVAENADDFDAAGLGAGGGPGGGPGGVGGGGGSNPIFDSVFVQALPVLADARVYHVLEGVFVDGCAAGVDDLDLRATLAMENASVVLCGLLQRITRAIPYGKKNRALWYLNLYDDAAPVSRMVDAAMDAFQHDETHPALYIALKMVIEILAALYFERQSLAANKSAAARIDSTVLERNVQALFPRLAAIVATKPAAGNADTGFGKARLKIVELFVACFKTCGEETIRALFEAGIHSVIYNLLFEYKNNSLLHNLVHLSVEVSLLCRRDTGWKPWLSEFQLARKLRLVWEEEGDQWSFNSHRPHLSTVLKLIICVHDLLRHLSAVGQDETSVELLGEEELKTFRRFYETSIAEQVQEQNKPLGGSRPVVPSAMSGMNGMDFGAANLTGDRTRTGYDGFTSPNGLGNPDRPSAAAFAPGTRSDGRDRRKRSGSLDLSFFDPES